MSVFRKFKRMQRAKALQKKDKELQAKGYKANQALVNEKDLVKKQTPYVKEV